MILARWKIYREKFEKSLRLFSNRKFCALAVCKTAIPAEPEPTQTFRVIWKGMVIRIINAQGLKGNT